MGYYIVYEMVWYGIFLRFNFFSFVGVFVVCKVIVIVVGYCGSNEFCFLLG